MSKKKMTGREVLEEALRRCCSTYCDQYPRYEGEIDLGYDYERYMNRLIKRSKNPFQRYFNTTGRRIAGIAAAVLIVFSCSMTVKAVRKPIVEFITNIYEEFVEIFFEKDDVANAPDAIETVYTLGFIPEGYNIEQSLIGDTLIFMVWKNETGEILIFSQNTLDASSILDTEESNYDVIEWGGHRIAFAEKYGAKHFYWNSDQYAFSLTVSSDMPQEQIFSLIDSLKKYNQ